MAYEYYRNSMPGWGTSQFQFGPPPAPMFQPQPSWGGLDFYNAHAINPDPMFYNSIMSRAPNFGSFALGRDDARYWHRRIYSGVVSLAQVLPNDVGAAAAYEAYRTWKHNSFLHEPLSADRVQQREGLAGMAIAEATRLWQHAGRSADTFGLRAAAEAAAAVASVLADRLIGYMGAGGGVGGMGMGIGMPGTGMPGVPSYASSGGSYARGPAAAAGYAGAGYRPRRSSIGVSTPLGGPAPGLGGSPFAGGSPYLAAPGGAGAGMHMGMGPGAYSESPGVSPVLGPAGGMGGPPYGGVPRSMSPLPGAGLGAGVGAEMGGVPGVGGAYGGGMGMPGAGAGLGMGGAGAGAGMGMGMGAGARAGTGMSMGGYPGMNTSMQAVPPGSTITVKHGGRRRRHSDAGRHRRRSSSVDVIQAGGVPYGGGYGGYGAGGGYAGSYGGGYGGGVGGYGAGMGSHSGGMGVGAGYGRRGIYGPPAYGGGAF